MLMFDVDLKFYSQTLYHNQELKSFTRYRFDKVKKLVSTLHSSSVYALLSEFPSTKAVANANLTKLTNLLEKSSKGKFSKNTAILFRDTARNSIGSNFTSKSLELKHTIQSIAELDAQYRKN